MKSFWFLLCLLVASCSSALPPSKQVTVPARVHAMALLNAWESFMPTLRQAPAWLSCSAQLLKIKVVVDTDPNKFITNPKGDLCANGHCKPGQHVLYGWHRSTPTEEIHLWHEFAHHPVLWLHEYTHALEACVLGYGDPTHSVNIFWDVCADAAGGRCRNLHLAPH